jgi:hypothetical protein
MASLLSRLRQRLDTRIGRKTSGLWPDRGVVTARSAAPEDALVSGASLTDVLEVAVHDSLRTTARPSLTGSAAATASASPPTSTTP